MKPEKPSNEIERLVRAFGYSADGFKAALRHPAFATECLAACVAIPMAFVLVHTGMERALLISSVFLILIVELLNTGIESAIDRISPEWHALSKRAKDVSSTAVLLSLINAAVIWLLVLLS